MTSVLFCQLCLSVKDSQDGIGTMITLWVTVVTDACCPYGAKGGMPSFQRVIHIVKLYVPKLWQPCCGGSLALVN